MLPRWLMVFLLGLVASAVVLWLIVNRNRPSVSYRSGVVRAAPVDFNGDRRSDWVVVREEAGSLTWFISNPGGDRSVPWGQPDDVLVPADYDGDGRTDIGVWRAGTFYIQLSTDSRHWTQPWGQDGDDVRVVSDYDGDGRADLAAYRPGSPSAWWILKSSDGASLQVEWGQAGDIPTPGDYDGDGRTDLAVKRSGGGSSAAIFHLLLSTQGRLEVPWGFGSDAVVPGDYDGDGRTDIAVARQEKGAIVFYVRRSTDATMLSQPWGQPGDVPAPGDYDGDRRTDFAVWRPSAASGGGAFFVRTSRSAAEIVQAWGQPRDRVAAAASGVH